MFIDTHCHLDAAEFAVDRDEVVRVAEAAGVSAVIVPAVISANFGAVRQCCARYAICRPAYGIHPLYIAEADENTILQLRAHLTEEMAGSCLPVAIGEIGLDHYVPGFDAARQEYFFIEQLKIARDFDLPVLLHVRRAVDQILKGLRRIGVRGGIAHAFNGSRQQADEFLRRGFKLGFGGAMTYPGSARIRQLAVSLPMEAIVLETDAPDIPPVWRAGGRNTPGDLGRIAGVLAELRGLSLAEIGKNTTDNACAILGLLEGCISRDSSNQQGSSFSAQMPTP